MTEKMTEMLTDDELDKVVGGGSFAMVEYTKDALGYYKLEITTFTGDKETWNDFCSGKSVKSLQLGFHTSAVMESKWDSWVARKQKIYGDGLIIREKK